MGRIAEENAESAGSTMVRQKEKEPPAPKPAPAPPPVGWKFTDWAAI